VEVANALGESLQEKRSLSWPIRAGFILHKVTNPFVRIILNSPLHSMLSGRLILVKYTGRKSGKEHSLPVQYAKSHDELVLVAGYHQHKKWWRNLLQQSIVKVCYRGKWFEASAKAFDGDVEVIAPPLLDYVKRFRASARIRGLTLDSSGGIENPEKLSEEAKKVVMVKIGVVTPEA
jgi:deazaflavin-dependent oxidoreductase (nitroreductase family)